MILTCPQCQSQYNLNPGKLGAQGRTVRCAACNHTWFQAGEEPIQVVAPEAPPEAAPKPEDAAFEAILSEVSAGAPPPIKDTATDSVYADPAQALKQLSSAPVITHNPFGVGATAFGWLTFLLWMSLTLTFLSLAHKPIIRYWPSTALLYQTMGFDILAPGEGIRFSEITAGQRIEKGGRMLVVEGKMTNMSERDITYPALRVTLKNAQGELLKEWALDAGATVLTSGETIPVMLQLPDMPPGGAAAEVGVRDR